MVVVPVIVSLIFAVLVAFAGVKRRIGFWKGLFWCIVLTPFIGLFIIMNSGRLDARGCRHCGNTYNEAEFCGICKKNEAGFTRSELANKVSE